MCGGFTMPQLKEANAKHDCTFKWGIKRGVGRVNKDVQFYESFTYDGVEYFLYDCVYLYDSSDFEPSIGRLVRIYETPANEKKVKVLWFFRPIEIRNYLGDYEPRWNEIFLASGEGKGLADINPLEAISQKCKVVCTSNDKRNPQASDQELSMADYIFQYTFDVGKCSISRNFADQIAGIKVEHFFNKAKDIKLITSQTIKQNVKELSGNMGAPRNIDGHLATDAGSKKATTSRGKQELILTENINLRPLNPIEHNGTGPTRILPSQVNDKFIKVRSFQTYSPSSESDFQPHKKQKFEDGVSEKVGLKLEENKGLKAVSKTVEVDRRPDAVQDKRKWFKQLPWEDRLRAAREDDRLVLLENLDPSFRSSEVEDLVWHALNAKVEAKMTHNPFSDPNYGKALVIFKSKNAADSAISALQNQCLMLADGRCVVGMRERLSDHDKTGGHLGHLVLYKRHRKQSEEMKKAVSTSHVSQPNNIAYDMAIEWRMLQEKSDMWWKELHKRQAIETEGVRRQLKTSRST